MNIRQSFLQTIGEARNNPGFTALYIGGVAFAVAFTMVFAIIYYVRLAPIYPEYNRNDTFYIKGISVRNESTNAQSMSSIGVPFVVDCIKRLKGNEFYSVSSNSESIFLHPQDGSGDFESVMKYVDLNFFRLFDFEFTAGRPFSEAEMQSALKKVVITEDLANRLYGSAGQAVGKPLSVGFIEYTIVGVVKPGTSLFANSFAQIFIPYTTVDEASTRDDARRYLGNYRVYLKVKDDRQMESLRGEITDMLRRINAADTTGWVTTITQMGTNTEMVFTQGHQEETLSESLRPFLTLFFVLLIIPAINISGMIGGQMDHRMAEMGLRRSFGGSKSSLCRQVMFENLLLTLVGGFIGLVVAWVVIYTFKGSILTLVSNDWNFMGDIVDVSISAEMLFAPVVFVCALLICIVLNLLSAYIPVRYALRRSIVSSLNAK